MSQETNQPLSPEACEMMASARASANHAESETTITLSWDPETEAWEMVAFGIRRL